MRNQYLKPEIELIQFNYKDIVAASDPPSSEVPQITQSFGVFSFTTIQNQGGEAVAPDNEIVWGDGSTD